MSRPANWKAIESLEAMSACDKARHWASEQPWRHKRKALYLPSAPSILPTDVRVAATSGDIISMPPLGGRPCFGQVTAYVRHGEWKFLIVRGRAQKTRCMRCCAREACAKVVTARIRSSPRIKDAHHQFSGAGGVNGLAYPQEFPRARGRWTAFVHLVATEGLWTSVNDNYARSWVQDRRDEYLAKDRARKASERKKKIRKGCLDEAFMQGMSAQRIYRAQLAEKAIDDPKSPRRVRMMPRRSAMITADVWMSRELLRLQSSLHISPGPSLIARDMIARERNCHLTHDVLRQRVITDLQRIAVLEASLFGAPPIWPPFKIEDTDPYEI